MDEIKLLHLDVLKEAGNIGAGHAASALSQLLGTKVNIKIPNVRVADLKEIKSLEEEAVVAAVFFRLVGEVRGSMFFMLQAEDAEELSYALTGKKTIVEAGMMDELAQSALMELGNMIAGSYLSALSDFTSLPLQPSVPSLAIDMAGAVLDVGFIELSKAADEAIVIDTLMEEVEKKGNQASGQIYLLPEPEACKQIFQALKVHLLRRI